MSALPPARTVSAGRVCTPTREGVGEERQRVTDARAPARRLRRSAFPPRDQRPFADADAFACPGLRVMAKRCPLVAICAEVRKLRYIRLSLEQYLAMPTTKRVLYSIQADVLERFNAMYKATQRSKVIEKLMLEAIDSREDRVARAAAAIAADAAAMRDHRETSEWVDAQSAHTANLT